MPSGSGIRWAQAATLLAATACYSSRGDEDAGRDADAASDAGASDVARDADVAADAIPDGDDSGDDAAGPWPVRFVLRLVSDIPESIWADGTDPAYGAHWIAILRGGSEIRKSPACGECMCGDCPHCAVCGAPCPTALEVPNGGSIEWPWSGLEVRMQECPAEPSSPCQELVPAPAGSYAARFCWGSTYEGTPPCPAEVRSVSCAEIPFELPDADGVVEYLVDHGG